MVSPIGWLRGEDIAQQSRESELRKRIDQLEQKAMSVDAVRADLLGIQSDGAEQRVDFDTAQLVTTVMLCARVIAEGLAQPPLKVLKPAADGGHEDATDHPAYRLLHRKPNQWQTAFEFREMLGLHLALCGNAFVFVIRNAKDQPIELLPYAPQSVELKRQGYVTRYFVKADGKKIEIPARNMWHLRGASLDGWQGIDPIDKAREAIGLGLATQKFGRNFFKNGATPGGLLSTDANLTAEQMDVLKASWLQTQSGVSNAGKTAILGGGMKYTAMSVSPDNAQFIETRKFQIEEICRVFRVLPIMVMHNEHATSYNSLEQQNLSHFQNTMAPWLERFEQSAQVALLSDEELDAGITIKFNTRAFFKATAKERADYYNVMINAGVLTRNECREAEDLNRIDDPLADQITPAANLFGQAPANNTGDNNSGDSKQ